MPRSKIKFSDDQKAALKAVLDDPDDKAMENPYAYDDTPAEEDQVDSQVDEDMHLKVAGNFVRVLEKLPDLNQNQRRIAYWLSKKNKSPAVIAARCGVSASYVKHLKYDPRVKEMIRIFRGGEIYDIAEELSAQEVLDNAAVRAAEVLAEKMNAALSEEVQIRAALAVLERTGYTSGDKPTAVQINIGEDVVARYQKAREEVGLDIPEAEAEIIE